MLTLSNLQVKKGAKKKKIRRGRGNASGYGNYSGRGIKGQRSRSGGKSGLKRLGMKKIIAQLPKRRGFNRISRKFNIINLNSLEKIFQDGEEVNFKKLLKLGLINRPKDGVKVLAKGDLKKKFTVKAHGFSKSAKEAIIKAGGEVIETPFKKRSLLIVKKKEVKEPKRKDKKVQKFEVKVKKEKEITRIKKIEKEDKK